MKSDFPIVFPFLYSARMVKFGEVRTYALTSSVTVISLHRQSLCYGTALVLYERSPSTREYPKGQSLCESNRAQLERQLSTPP